ncbi:hypothetical protein D3C81_1572390 [compost metagenome]
MQDEIDIQLQGIQVVAARGVVAHGRLWAVVLAGAEYQGVQCRLLRRVLREQQLDVVVGAETDETGQLRAAQGNAAHARGQVDDAQDFKFATFDLVHHTVNG